MTMNYLKAVFWDYPELCNPQAIEKKLQEARSNNDRKTLTWVMARFLERGRFKDTTSFFGKEEIRGNLDDLAISHRARKKWQRFLEVYGKKLGKTSPVTLLKPNSRCRVLGICITIPTAWT